MRIIETHLPRQKTMQIKCRNCQSVVEYTEAELKYEDDSGTPTGGSYTARCPVCHCDNYADTSKLR